MKKLLERGPTYDDLFLLFLQMKMYFKFGSSSLVAVNNLIDQTENTVLNRALQNMSKDLKDGESLAGTVLKQKCFPPFCGHIISAGQESGKLDMCLEQISYDMEQTSDILRRLFNALFPLILGFVGISFSLAVFLIYVNPFFQDMFSSLDIELPLINRIMMGLSNFLSNYWHVLLLGLIVSGYSFWKYCTKYPIVMDKLLLNIPIYKVIHYNFLQYRFVKIFKLLIDSGIPSLKAIELTADAIGNEVMAQMLRKAALQIRKGYEPSQALEINNANKILSKMIINLIKSGETNGAKSLSESLDEAANFFKKIVASKTEVFGSKISPWILIPAFAIAFLIIYSIQSPILSMNVGA